MKIPAQAKQHNIADFIEYREAGCPVISRIPESLWHHLNNNARQRALNTSGCEIRFRLLSPTAKVSVQACEVLATQHGMAQAQILFGDFSYTYFPVGREPTEIEINAPDYDELLEASSEDRLFSPRLVRLLLPPHTAISELSIEGELALPEPEDVPAKRVLNYGSSITHGVGALSSRETWAARCAHSLGFDLINLGFGGGCHCEPEMAEYLCHRDDFDCAILETGINMLEMEPSQANQRIAALIEKVSAAHRQKPIYCLGVFPCRDDSRTHWSGRAQEIRDLVRRTVERLNSPNLHFIDGSKAVSHARGMTVDLVHPSPAGMIDIGTYVAREISRITTCAP